MAAGHFPGQNRVLFTRKFSRSPTIDTVMSVRSGLPIFSAIIVGINILAGNSAVKGQSAGPPPLPPRMTPPPPPPPPPAPPPPSAWQRIQEPLDRSTGRLPDE